MKNIKEYIEKVKSHLFCNASEEYAGEYVTYTYSNEEIDQNIDYFDECRKRELSEYKALLLFDDYLEDKGKNNF
jgi:hypothetical protein